MNFQERRKPVDPTVEDRQWVKDFEECDWAEAGYELEHFITKLREDYVKTVAFLEEHKGGCSDMRVTVDEIYPGYGEEPRTRFGFEYKRPENWEEREKRLAREERARQSEAEREERERQEFLRLKKKYGEWGL